MPATSLGTALLHACRPLQAAKNLLVFVPLLAAHGPFTRSTLGAAAATSLVFALVASAVYLVNDVADVAADRTHPRKRNRAVASGRVAPATALALAGGLVVAAAVFLHACSLPGGVGRIVGAYLALALIYALGGKRLLLIDVFLLAALSLARILAGGAATATPISPWLMALSGFLFLSLAFLKRYGELGVRAALPDAFLPGRPYRGGDAPILRTAGLASAYLAALVLALYVNGEQAAQLYPRPELLWLTCPAFLYWITRLWIRVDRGEGDEDPVVLALADPASYLAGAWILASALAAAL